MQYLSAALVLAILTGFLWACFLRQKKTPHKVHLTIPGLSLRISHSGGMVQDLILPAGRIRCGFSPDYDIDLSTYMKAGHTSGKLPVEELTFQLVDGRLAVAAHSKVMMNGVERSSGSIPIHGSLLFRTCRFTFLGQAELVQEQSVLPGSVALRKLAVLPSLASLAAVALLILGLVDLGVSGHFQRVVPEVSIAEEILTAPEPEREAEVEPIPTPMAVPVLTPKPGTTPVREKGPAFAPRLVPTPYPAFLVVDPGQAIPDARVDVLFIHAHPDDESIDFGTLMALCREAGLSTATVLLTDGEGGIFQEDYTGPRHNIVATRVQEARSAMQYLGSSLYIRLGLRNNPYNSLVEEKAVQDVLKLWDGDAIAIRLAEIISALGPKVVVSPEGPSFAREHFEHEATGVLTLMALQHLRLTGGQLPEAHLVSVDPRQKEAYSGLVSFPRRQVLERQRQALLSHATQADATYFGVQMIEKFPEEFYLIRYWDLPLHFNRFFGLVSVHKDVGSVPGRPCEAYGTPYRWVA